MYKLFNMPSLRRVSARIAVITSGLVSIALITQQAHAASSVSGYIPLKQDPVFETHINRLLISAEMGGVKKPYSINYVKQAYNQVCSYRLKGRPALTKACHVTKAYLDKTQQGAYISHASTGVRIISDDNLVSDQPSINVANGRGEQLDSNWFVQGQAAMLINDYVAVSAGAKIWQTDPYFDRASFNNQYSSRYDINSHNLEDTYVSVGLEAAQLDIGYKPHWLSPFKHSAMLLSTNAPTFANISLSNNTPLTDLNFNYEFFAGELSHSDNIRYQGGYTQGKPLITGVHLSISPFSGFTLAVNRILQSGGGDRGGRDFGDLIDAFIDPSGSDNTREGLNSDEEFGNQAASIVTRYDFAGATPFSVYMEYAGEDTSRGTNYRLGNTSLSAGLDIPVVFHRFSVNYEYSQWQRLWYSHHVYQDGLINQGSIIGHWAAEQRLRTASLAGDAQGATHHNINVGWQLGPDERLEFGVNTTTIEPLAQYDYSNATQFSVDWYTTIAGYRTAVSLMRSKNTLNEKHTAASFAVYW